MLLLAALATWDYPPACQKVFAVCCFSPHSRLGITPQHAKSPGSLSRGYRAKTGGQPCQHHRSGRHLFLPLDPTGEGSCINHLARQARIEYPGAIHHGMSRGDRREPILLDDVDRQDFLKTLAEGCEKGDHVHGQTDCRPGALGHVQERKRKAACVNARWDSARFP